MAKLPKGITKRSDGLYMGRFQISGVRYCCYGKTVKGVQSQIDNMKYEAKHGTLLKPERLTVDSWFTTWLDTYKKNNVKIATYDRYSNVYQNCISSRIGKFKLVDVKPQMIQKLINDLHDAGYAQTTIKLVDIVLHQLFKQAVKDQLILYNPVEAVTLPSERNIKPEERRVMTPEEQKTFMEYAESSVYYPYYVLALETGMRINEVCGLEWSDIDFKKKEIHVSGTLHYERGSGRWKDTPKTRTSDRIIPMLPDVEAILKSCSSQQKRNRLKLGAKYKTEPGLEHIVLTYPEGGAFWDEGIRKDIQKIVDRINADGIEFAPIHPHTFRHTFATRAAESGMPMQVLKTILGHSSLAMTADLYSHVLPDTKQDEMQKIANMF